MKKNKKVSQLNDAPLNQPQNRTELFLAKIAKLVDTAPTDTRNRLERYLAAIAESTEQAGTISANTETTVEGLMFGNSTTGKVEGVASEMSAQNVEDYLEAVEEAVTAGGVVAQQQLATVENTNTASRAYRVGEYLCYNGLLYRVTVAIASGESISPGTNCAATTVSAGLVKSLTATVTSDEYAKLPFLVSNPIAIIPTSTAYGVLTNSTNARLVSIGGSPISLTPNTEVTVTYYYV